MNLFDALRDLWRTGQIGGWVEVEVAETEAAARAEEDRRARVQQEQEANERFEADIKARAEQDKNPDRW